MSPRRKRLPLLVTAAFAVLLSTLGAIPQASVAAPVDSTLPAASVVPAPVLTRPPEGIRGHPLWDSFYNLRPFGYVEQEFLVSGTAKNAAGEPAPYTTRMIVTRPAAAEDFNGTVMLDWVNVTAQFENAVDTMEAREMLMREGFAFVHVSAQKAGVCCTPLTPQAWDPVRYAGLNHPGDAWSEDMFTQIAQAFRSPRTGSPDPMGKVGHDRVKGVLAVGQSQSAGRLYGYLNSWLPDHPAAVGLIDGFLVHGLAQATKTFDRPLPGGVKVLHLLSDLEANDDGVKPGEVDRNYRLWEIAGTAHSDLFVGHQTVAGHSARVLTGADKLDRAAYRTVIRDAGNYGERLDPELATCTVAGASMPMHYSVSTAIHQLNVWTRTGRAPRNGPRFEFEAGALAKDAHGNALGGIRLPPIDVPVATYQSTACGLGGITVPFTDAQIQQLYPTHSRYLALMRNRTDVAVRRGWLLRLDARDLMRRACAASGRWGSAAPRCPRYRPPVFDQR